MGAVERLRLLNLPVFKSAEDLAGLIHIDRARLEMIIKNPEHLYRVYTIPKPSGGRRLISDPGPELKAIQAWILRNILDKLAVSAVATAFRRGKSVLDNVLPHAYNRYFVCIDIRSFFPSVRGSRVCHIFEVLGYPPDAAKTLTNLCTYLDSLPQGGVTSPSLANLVAARLDRRLIGLASRRNIAYTRYADDMTFSSNNRDRLHKSISLFLDIIRSERFVPHPGKLRVMGPRIRCQVTGLVKDSAEPRFSIGRFRKRRMRAVMHSLSQSRLIDFQYGTIESIEGWLSYVKGVDETSYNQMKRYWDRLRTQVEGK